MMNTLWSHDLYLILYISQTLFYLVHGVNRIWRRKQGPKPTGGASPPGPRGLETVMSTERVIMAVSGRAHTTTNIAIFTGYLTSGLRKGESET